MGTNAVSRRPSSPAANEISGVEQLPKAPVMLVATAALEVATVLVALVVVTLAVLVFPEAFFEDVETDLAVLAVTVTVD